MSMSRGLKVVYKRRRRKRLRRERINRIKNEFKRFIDARKHNMYLDKRNGKNMLDRVLILGVCVIALLFMFLLRDEDSLADVRAEYHVDAESAYINDNMKIKDVVMEVSGTVSYLTWVDAGLKVTLDSHVDCYFKGDDIKAAVNLTRGMPVTIKGKSCGQNPYNGNIECVNCCMDF